MCERQRGSFVKKVSCVRQNNRPVLQNQHRKLMLLYWLGFSPLSGSDFAGVIGTETHHPCAETILNILLSLCIAPLCPCAERDGITALDLFRKSVYEDFAGACLWCVPCAWVPVTIALLIKLHLTFCNVAVVINSKTIPFHQISRCVWLPAQLSECLNPRHSPM